jgi:tRNA threonylcarbamoyladenosine biosynthesis protein TsaB
MILCIETAAEYCSVAIAKNGITIALVEEHEPNSHATRLTLLIQAAFAQANCSAQDLKAVAVSAGPGSYTGLRIGAATAKGIAYANNIPLLAVPTLQAIAAGAQAAFLAQANPQTQTPNPQALYLPMLDARRMEVYMAAHDADGAELVAAEPFIITEEAFAAYLEAHNLIHYTTVIACGNGAKKAKDILLKYNIIYFDNNCSSKYMSRFAHELYEREQFENLAYFEPNYLKAANITVAKPKEA